MRPAPSRLQPPPQPTWLHHLLRSDEEEQGSDEEDGSDEEHVEATPAPRSSAKKAKPKTTPASSRAASRRAKVACLRSHAWWRRTEAVAAAPTHALLHAPLHALAQAPPHARACARPCHASQ